jgi:hypothetical protein
MAICRKVGFALTVAPQVCGIVVLPNAPVLDAKFRKLKVFDCAGV